MAKTRPSEPPPYEAPPPWIPAAQRWKNPIYNSNLSMYLPRVVELKKQVQGQPLGFNIRGGRANEGGVFISKVLAESEAEKLGLKPGDEILSVNNADFTDIPHNEAVEILKRSMELKLKVQYFPYGYDAQMKISGILPM
ncbi:PDZ domain-containing protein 11-like [Styela clava]|uniref:PDZ domain-containing protein 11-like n=1 Tax=Styela clava TaxID=7725 RepID=UPI00193A4462|nr:PDZ domain-containing protein 11-like [Styela clava]